MEDIKQVFADVMRNPRLVVAAILGLAGAYLGWRMMDYVVSQIGSQSPELALPYFIIRVGAVLLFGLAAAGLVLEKR